MNVLLAAVNAKYIHTNLAVRYLEKSVAHILGENIQVKEFTINNNLDYIMQEIYDHNPDIICFSCYIWNIDIINYITRHIKKVMPGVIIVVGGPEVSFETKEFMRQNDSVDIAILGEGEETFKELILALKTHGDYSLVEGIAFRARGQIIFTEPRSRLLEIASLPFPYEGERLDKNKIVYYESSRGCPFNCQYCLSSTISGVRYLPIDRVKKELKYFIDQGVRQVKFIDRTFNANKAYAMEIMKFILENYREDINFHFEVTADLLDNKTLEFLKTVPVGLFQFEIGVQSTNEDTLKEIDREMDFEKLSSVVTTISQGKNIHQHLDLIVGLPEEDYFSFRRSFNDVFNLRPEKLQMGFLKLLKGSGLRARAESYGCVYSDYAPYEVMETNCLSYGDILRLKGIEEMVESYWNSNIFTDSVEFTIQNFYSSNFNFFEDLWKYWKSKGHHHISHNKLRLYEIFMDFYNYKEFSNLEIFKEILKFDFFKNTKTWSVPQVFNRVRIDDFKNKCHKFLQDSDNLKKYLPSYMDMPAKQIIKQVYFQPFNIDVTSLSDIEYKLDKISMEKTVVLFDYLMESRALENSKYYKVDFN